ADREADEFDGMLLRIGMRQTARVLGDAAVVGETRNRFYVRERRPAQAQPFGLEDARTRLARHGRQKFLQHRPAPVMQLSKRKKSKTKRGGRFPASPSGALIGLRRFVRTRRTRFDPPLFSSLGHRKYGYDRAAIGFGTKLDAAFDLGEESMVSAHADIKAGVPGRAALTRDDVAGNDMLTTERLDSEPLARRITSVSR